MVRGNWQRRVEKTEARRAAAKQRKQRQNDRSKNVLKGKELLAFLDQHTETLKRSEREWFLHVWVDSLPDDAPPLLDIYGEQEYDGTPNSKRRGKARSNSSTDINESKKGPRGRGRSNSTSKSEASSSDRKKKSHPRSKDETEIETDVEDSTAPRLCRPHFFTGKCQDSHRKSSCLHIHCPKKQETLATIMGSNKNKVSSRASPYKWKQQLDEAAEAAKISEMEDTDEDTGAMDMLYYFSIRLLQGNQQHDAHIESISEIVSKSLSNKSCNIGSIVYVCINDYILFDRHRNGIVISDTDSSLLGSTSYQSTFTSIHTNGVLRGSDAESHPAIMLPGPLLEHIVSFLPDNGILVSRVCRAWYQEIGQSSPFLWRNLLQRRGWPLPPTFTVIDEALPSSSNSSDMNVRNLFRDNFVSNYKAVRDIEAIKLALPPLLGLTRGLVEEKEMVYQAFLTRRGAPQEPNVCSSIKVWSPKRVIAAYEHDCTLRLFEAVEKSSTNSRDLRGCREVVCFRAAPYQNTKKRTCALVAMDLDEEMIGCLCHVNKGDEIEGYYLTVFSKEDVLCSGGAVDATDKDESLCTINVGEAVLHYLLSLLETDHRLVRLYDLLLDSGGELPDVQIVASRNVVACGYGRFMVEVSIWIPDETEEFVTESVLLDRKLVLLSTSTESVVWIGDSNITQIQQRLDDVRIVSIRESIAAGGHRSTCSIAVASSWSPNILTVEIDPAGHAEHVETIESSSQVQAYLLQDGWEVGETGNGHRCRPVVITPSDIIVVDNLQRENRRIFRKSVISFYSRGTHDHVHSILTLDFECETLQMLRFRDDHVVLICRLYEYKEAETEELEEDVTDLASENDCQEKIEAVIVSVESRKVLHQVCLLEDAANLLPVIFDHDIPISLCADQETLGVGVSWCGMVLTGQDIRSVGRTSLGGPLDSQQASNNASKKKKKKRQSGKGNKKDGFARGMSLRG